MSRRCGSSKPTPTHLNGLAMKPRKTRRKLFEGSVDTIIRQTTVKTFPRNASVVGGARRKSRYDKANHRQKPSANRQHGGWRGETKKGELKENAGAMTKETNVKTLPQVAIVAGARRKGIAQWSSSCGRPTQAHTNASVEAFATSPPLFGTERSKMPCYLATTPIHAEFRHEKSPFEHW